MEKKILVLTLLALLLVACTNTTTSSPSKEAHNTTKAQADTEEFIQIGGILPKSGDMELYGSAVEKGIQLAIEQINDKGGLKGKKIQYRSEDDKGDPEKSIAIYNRLSEANMNAIVGGVLSESAIALAENSSSLSIPILTPTATAEKVTQGHNNLFRTCFTDSLQGKALANFAADHLNAKTAALLYNTSSNYSNNISQAFKAQAKLLGLHIVAEEGYEDKDENFKLPLTHIQQKNPDVILVAEYYNKDLLIAKQMRDLGIEATILGSDGWEGVLDKIDKGSVDILDHVYFTSHYCADDSNKKVQQFVKDYQKKYDEVPSSFAALGYDTLYLYQSAFEKAQSSSSQDVLKALREAEAEGVTGKITIENGNNATSSITILEIEKGAYHFNTHISVE